MDNDFDTLMKANAIYAHSDNPFAPKLNFDTRCAVYALVKHKRLYKPAVAKFFNISISTIGKITSPRSPYYQNIRDEAEQYSPEAFCKKYITERIAAELEDYLYKNIPEPSKPLIMGFKPSGNPANSGPHRFQGYAGISVLVFIGIVPIQLTYPEYKWGWRIMNHPDKWRIYEWQYSIIDPAHWLSASGCYAYLRDVYSKIRGGEMDFTQKDMERWVNSPPETPEQVEQRQIEDAIKTAIRDGKYTAETIPDWKTVWLEALRRTA